MSQNKVKFKERLPKPGQSGHVIFGSTNGEDIKWEGMRYITMPAIVEVERNAGSGNKLTREMIENLLGSSSEEDD